MVARVVSDGSTLADLAAVEHRPGVLDRVDDVEERDLLGGRPRQKPQTVADFISTRGADPVK
jgi:hypothetical protein